MYTFLTVLHVVVCIFLMLVVLLQAGRGGGIGLAFGGSGGSQSVFGSSGGATFLTKMTAICAVIFFTNSLALAYMSSQSDSRRLQRIAEKKALTKKSEDATNAKMLTDIEKQREEQAKAAAAKSTGEGAPAEGAAGEKNAEDKAEDKAPAAIGKAADLKMDKSAPTLKLTLPEQGGGKATPGAHGKLAADLKMGKPEKTDKPAAGKKPAAKKPAAEKPAEEKKSDESAAEQPAAE